MVARTAVVVALVSALLVLFGCGGGGEDYYSQQGGPTAGVATLDIAGTYQATPPTFFNTLSISQSGNNLTASDSSDGSWEGTLSNITRIETAGPGGTTVFSWRGDITLSGKNAVGDALSLTGQLEITSSAAGNLITITAEYENTSIGLSGQLVLTQVSTTPGADGGSTGWWNK